MLQQLLSRIDAETERRKLNNQQKKRESSITEAIALQVYKKVVGPPIEIDWKDPDYSIVQKHRDKILDKIRRDKSVLPALKFHYKNNPADFINDWGWTIDPRNVERKLPAKVPFILFPRQVEWIEFVMRKWHSQEPGLTEKSRDGGLSWLAVSLACTLCLFYDGVVIGFGSRKSEYVDKVDAPKSLFYKARKFMESLPPEFNGGWDKRNDAPYLRLNFRASGSHINGESGDGIGRGDRASIYFVDEAAHLERPQLVEASLSQTTNCRQDISSVNGTNNPFYEKGISGRVEKFVFDWRDDPRKDDEWYQKQVSELDPVTVAQEINRDYAASVEGIIIPSAWVRAAIDAHKKLGFIPTGVKRGALDIADEGADLNAFCGIHGPLIEFLEEWSGKGGDIFKSVEHAFALCDQNGYDKFRYDADGIGANVRGDARVINEKRKKEQGARQISVFAFRGSAGVSEPEKEDVKGRKNEDYFKNCKAQSWSNLRDRFRKTFQAVDEGKPYNPDDIISISTGIPKNLLNKLVTELSQPTWAPDNVGKMVVDKSPDGSRSPNLADAVMIAYGRIGKTPIVVSNEILQKAAIPVGAARDFSSEHKPRIRIPVGFIPRRRNRIS